MRRMLVPICASIVVLLQSPAGGAWSPDMDAAERYSRSRSGEISFAVKSPSGRLHAYRGHRVVPAASVLKAMFLTAYLRHPSVRDRALTDDDRALLGPMIKRSDDDSATRIADRLGPRPMYRLARDAGMKHFRYTRPWGLSRIDASEQARFFFHLERYIPARHEDYARYLLSHIVRSQRWGVAEVRRPDWKLYFKSGWGSRTGAVSHQVAFLENDGSRIALSITIENSPDHAYSTDTLRGIAARLLRDLP